MHLLIIDNYDSFTYNLAQLFEAQGARVTVLRNDAVDVGELASTAIDGLCISPGPGRPSDAGCSAAAVLACAATIPVFGVCLGMQVINEVYGGATVHAPTPMHGKTDSVRHDGSGIFRGLPSPFAAARYHSLVVEIAGSTLLPTAHGSDGTVMALRHSGLPLFGVQFHPESFLTEGGGIIARNFLDIVREMSA